MDRNPKCSGKTRYVSADQARKARNVIIGRSGRKKGQEVKVYYCEGCAGYHFGRSNNLSRPPWAARPRRMFCADSEGSTEPARWERGPV